MELVILLSAQPHWHSLRCLFTGLVLARAIDGGLYCLCLATDTDIAMNRHNDRQNVAAGTQASLTADSSFSSTTNPLLKVQVLKYMFSMT